MSKPATPDGWTPHFSGYRHFDPHGGCHVEVRADHLHISQVYVDVNDPCGFSVPLAVVYALLAAQGLRVVPESELVPAPFTIRQLRSGWELVPHGSKAVLDAMHAIPDGTLQALLDVTVITFSLSVLKALKAEQARRTSQSGDQIAPDTAEPAEKQPDSR